MLFKRKILTIAEMLQNCPLNAVLPGGEEPFILGQFLASHPPAGGEGAAESASRRWRCLQNLGGRESQGRQGTVSQREKGEKVQGKDGGRIEQWQWSLYRRLVVNFEGRVISL